MSLAPGGKLGPYEIVETDSQIGRGEVYRARDTRAGSEVSVVVSAGPISESLEREARAVASLNHPNICALQDVGRHDGIDFLVLEHLKGQTLAERLIKQKPLHLRETMTVAIAIADALDKAHGQGAAHRGLNPARVMLTDTGAKLLDFGLPSGDANPAEYTAPERLAGKDGDTRSDLYSFGCILYEMVARKKAFEGKSRAVLTAAISTTDPDPLPIPALQHIVARCLAKDPDRRWQTAHDLLVQLRWIAGTGASPVATAAAPAGKREKLLKTLLAVTALLIVALAVPAGLYLWGDESPAQFQIRVPVIALRPPDVALSPDGRTLALVADLNGESALYARPVGAVNFSKLVTAAAAQPFWSPDSSTIGFVAGGKLRRVSVAGGAAQDIATVSDFTGGTWNRDGTILFGSGKGIFRVSAEGGTPALATALDPGQTGHFWPSFLPDGAHFLYLGWSADGGKRALFVGKLDSKEKTRLMASEANAAYAAPGYLIFQRQASLFAQPFDGSTLSGKPVLLADQVGSNTSNGRGYFDVSQKDTLFYFQGNGGVAGGRAGTGAQNNQLGWMDRTGNVLTVAGELALFGDFDLSPDGKLIALTRQESNASASTADIWVVDWQRAGAATRLTLDAADDLNPVWSPDGARIAFTTYRKGNADIYVKNANGVGAETPLLETPADELVEDWSKDGRYIAYLSGADEFRDIYVLPLSGDKKPFPVVQGRFRKDEPQFSYDGKWLAYTSNETGTFQVNVISFPALDQKLQVSVNGGGQPRWKKDSSELYFRDPETNTIMSAEIKRGAKLEAGAAPQPLFSPQTLNGSPTKDLDATRHQLSVTPDGLRFLLRVSTTYARGGSGGSAVPQAAFQRGFRGGLGGATRGVAGGIPERGLTVIRHWTAGLGKAKP